MPSIRDILRLTPVMPVIVIERIEHAVPLARALVAGGLRVLEVTLRTADALEAVCLIAKQVPDAILGVGTVTRADEFAQAATRGAVFAVSPGLTPELLVAARSAGMPFLPGVMTPSDIVLARSAGFDAVKFFPAQPAGGVPMLKAFAGPFPDMMFCPTGGITLKTAPEFLTLPNVACVGGSWMTPRDLIAAENWLAITSMAQEACALRAIPVRMT